MLEKDPFTYFIMNDIMGWSLVFKEEAVLRSMFEAAGFKWQDAIQESRGKETLSQDRVQDAIEEVNDTITNEVLTCTECSRNYRILPAELTFYRKMSIPVPERCFFCRMTERENMRAGFDLSSRQCGCQEGGHEHEGRCPAIFQTSFTEKEERAIYCEDSYLKVLD